MVVDSGAIGSHAAIVAREYGIPAVMGTGDGTHKLSDGQHVCVDGDRGLVFRHGRADDRMRGAGAAGLEGAMKGEVVRKPSAAVGSAVFFVLVPGTAVGLVPWWITDWEIREPLPYWAPARVVGASLIVAGAAVLIHAFARFVVEGLGTPAPVAPPEHLVVGGFYRYVRNPMYVAVLAIIVGQALALGQLILLAYAVAAWIAFASFVHFYEEPALSRRFGARYEAYRRAVPAWWPRLRPWRTGERDSPGAR